MNNRIKDIIDSHPLALEYETDARDVWPKRWAKLCAELDKPITEHPDVQRLIKQAGLEGFKIKELQDLLQKGLNLYFEFSNKDDFDKWAKEAKQALKG